METLRIQMGKAAMTSDAAIFLPKISSRSDRLVSPNFKKDRGGYPFRMNKNACQASKNRTDHKIYWRTNWQQNECGVRNVSPRWAISGTQQTNGSAGPAELSAESSWELFKTSQQPITDDFSHNFGFLYLTHTHLVMRYMLSEVPGMGFRPLKSNSDAVLRHPVSHSHTHTKSLFFPNHEIDATNGSFASRTLAKKDDSDDPPRKSVHLENPQGSEMETGRLPDSHSRRSTQCGKAFRSDFPPLQNFGPSSQDQRASIRMVGKAVKTQSRRPGKVAASMTDTCRICEQPLDAHDQDVHDAVVRSMSHPARGPIVPAEDAWIREEAI